MQSAFDIHILTIFPELFESFLASSLVHKASERGLLITHTHNIRDFAPPPHHRVDDTPYGGGAGMVMRPDILVHAIEAVKKDRPDTHVVLLSASGTPFDQAKAKELSEKPSLTLVCGRYEGVDQRAIALAIDEELSVGNYVVMGGEVPAMLILEATLRLRPGVLGNEESISSESFQNDSQHGLLLEGPQYTKPPEFRGMSVPEVLLSGNHQRINAWRKEQSLAHTRARRPELLKKIS